MNSSLLRKVLYNTAIIGAGSAAFVWYDRTRDSVPKQVQRLVHDAVELELSPSVEADNGAIARKKWREAVITAKANNLDPKVGFNVNFFLACNLEESGKREEAEREFKQALASFPLNFDYATLDDATRNRVAVSFDRLAQMAQDRKDFKMALKLYVDGLEALARPEDVVNADEKFMAKKEHVKSVAGLLNNMMTLLYEVGREDEAKKSEAMSVWLKAVYNDEMPPPLRRPIEITDSTTLQPMSEQ